MTTRSTPLFARCPLRLRIAAALAAILSLLPGASGSAGDLTGSTGMSVAIPVPFPQDLTFCYGWNDDVGRCELYVGSAAACQNVVPCPAASLRLAPVTEKLTACYGWNEHTHQCLLYIGSASACKSLRSC